MWMWKALLVNLLGFWLSFLLFIGVNGLSYYLYTPCTMLVPCDAPHRVGFPLVFMTGPGGPPGMRGGESGSFAFLLLDGALGLSSAVLVGAWWQAQVPRMR